MQNKYVYLLLVLFLVGCAGRQQPASGEIGDAFVKVQNGQFMLDGKPLYFIGTNFWYGPILGSQSEFGDRDRLVRELDFMKEHGITNLRVLVGADGPDNLPMRVMPTLQKTPGVYDDCLFDGLDFFMNELAKRDMYAVLYLTNNWDWSGGHVQYMDWCGRGPAPVPTVDGWNAFGDYVAGVYSCDSCTMLLKDHIAHVFSRTNFYNQRKYTEDPNILSWQIANEPRPMSDAAKERFEVWTKELAAYIKSLDANHLLSTGSEGQAGSQEDFDLYARVHADPNIDYLTIHIWPKNWSWIDPADIPGSITGAIEKTDAYIDKHISLANQLNKPITLEEFGLPRDHHQYTLSDSTTCRDAYYAHVFDKLVRSAASNDRLSGCNFWAWGGFARPAADHVNWRIGDDYMGDPGQEEQGLNSVFDTDHTVDLIRSYASKLPPFNP